MILGPQAWGGAHWYNAPAAGGPDPRESDRENECGGMNAADAGGGCRRRMQEEEEGSKEARERNITFTRGEGKTLGQPQKLKNKGNPNKQKTIRQQT